MFSLAGEVRSQALQELRPGVLIDSDLGHCFLMGPKGIDAVEIRSGARLWHSDQAVKPIALQGKSLIAQAAIQEFGRLRLIILDVETGSQLRSAFIDLPQEVFAHTTDTLGASFDLWSLEVQTGARGVLIAWRFEQRVAQGMAPTGDASAKASFSGSFRLDPGTGESTPLTEVAQRSRERWLVASQERIDGVPGRQFVERRESHVLASNKVADPGVWNRYQWTVYSGEGQRLGALDTFISFAPFVVYDSLLLFETPPFSRTEGETEVAAGPMFRTVDLRNGAERWSRPLREIAYPGPFPP